MQMMVVLKMHDITSGANAKKLVNELKMHVKSRSGPGNALKVLAISKIRELWQQKKACTSPL